MMPTPIFELPDEFEDDQAYRKKMESAAEATRILREGQPAGLMRGPVDRRKSLEQLSELMAAVAIRLAHEGVTWQDIAYHGAETERQGLFSPHVYTSEMLSHIFTQSVSPDYVEARQALQDHFSRAYSEVYNVVIEDYPGPVPSDEMPSDIPPHTNPA